MTDRPGERFGFEAQDCAPALRLEAHQAMARLQFETVHRRLEKIEAMMERLERRLWISVYGVVGMILAQAVQSMVQVTP
ncbi:hypothetical protein DRV85_01870 [Rhodosalinus halophilus]|uniref:Gene transfer agent protein n=1 Tax=Rhodosalinus halophilus TaxID=2259333 RepID=A0A365UDR6_9RHOB|nr:hypothetical protein [Rhodosalinus halophilus]RBI87686.1 hypothetical protein DRV85_01870 [Rhodosalinus halophilus]